MSAKPEIQQIGRYRILKPLGQGAMATVYLAELATLGGFRRKVALKVVRDEFARDPKFGQLMAREAMIGSLLQHPNIVETLEFNEADDRMFLALEFVEGETVEDLLKSSRDDGQPALSAINSLEVVIQVLKGLSYAHGLRSAEGEAMGIVHRDLKPGNIMVSRHGVVKVMDFGIAKAKVACATITAAGQVRGTPIYMAPEQVTGRPLDGRADQFAAATVLQEMLTGEQVFLAKNLIEIMRKVSRADVGNSLESAGRLHPDLPAVLARMWSKDPTDRYEDCGDAARSLEEVLLAVQRDGIAPVRTPKKKPAAGRPTRTGRRKAQKEPKEEPRGMFDLVAALGFGSRRKAKPEPPPPRKKRRRRKKTGEATGAMADVTRTQSGPMQEPQRRSGGMKRPRRSKAGASPPRERAASDETISGPGRPSPRPSSRAPTEEPQIIFDTTFGTESVEGEAAPIPPTAPMPAVPDLVARARPSQLAPPAEEEATIEEPAPVDTADPMAMPEPVGLSANSVPGAPVGQDQAWASTTADPFAIPEPQGLDPDTTAEPSAPAARAQRGEPGTPEADETLESPDATRAVRNPLADFAEGLARQSERPDVPPTRPMAAIPGLLQERGDLDGPTRPMRAIKNISAALAAAEAAGRAREAADDDLPETQRMNASSQLAAFASDDVLLGRTPPSPKGAAAPVPGRARDEEDHGEAVAEEMDSFFFED